ncbi:benzoate 4-monooxygenase cytochrome P450 [Zopfia rhizophila CBS 207.26]|uniref:Benzoate 4-monooxygenase cytochrome P450 n=1 Tax=Zopfia rhizophila CBS 207.26 TaxID=1314779 RepID=A0A6A6DHM8_9PEZI|nr:benzoate 4-monooxygenase cytochrome P450 [Zopfia rhizophila CBS 207.26]
MALSDLIDQIVAVLRSLKNVDFFILTCIPIIAYFVSSIIYRLTFHPLAKYPGNFIEKISGWPEIYYHYNGSRHMRILEAHNKYGPIVRVGPNKLDFNTTTAVAAIHRDKSANVKKGDWYKTVDAENGAFSVQTVIDKHEHAFRRKMISPSFSEAALRDSEQFIIQNVDIFLRRMGEKRGSDGWTKARDFSEWCTYYGFDYTSDLAFGSRFGLVENDEHRYLADLLKNLSHFVYYAGHLPIAPALRLVMGTGIMNYMPSKAARDTHKYFLVSTSKLHERQALEEAFILMESSSEKPPKSNFNVAPRKDIFHYLFRSRDPETGLALSPNQLSADAGLLIAAGSDGVAITLSAALFYLLSYPTCLEKLSTELQKAFSSIEEIRLPKLNHCAYLHAVIEESLRLAPCAPSAFPREVLSGGIVVDGHYIPAGITVGTSPYALHHNEAYYPNSFAFIPERWIGGAEKVRKAKEAFSTFSHGTYSCIGKSVAYLAIKLLLARLLWRYDVKAAEEGNDAGELIGGGGAGKWKRGKWWSRKAEYQMEDFLVGYRQGPIVRFREREIE